MEIPQTGTTILSDFVVYDKYAKYLPELKRKETFDEICTRSSDMYKELYPFLSDEIDDAYDSVRRMEVMPSMRSLQFGGKALLKNSGRAYNCSYLPVSTHHAFSETLYLLLLGCGVGWSVRRRHVYNLPSICKPNRERKFLIADSSEGWADAVKALFKAYFYGSSLPKFDYSDIRPKGATLSSGGFAPGPEPLRLAIEHCHSILRAKYTGDKLSTLEAHDCLCHLSDAVLAGGIRRSAAIALFDYDDELMLYCKTGNWMELNPQRMRANNSVSLQRSSTTREQFDKIWNICRLSGSGEPGIFWTTDHTDNWGGNPCNEISLRPYQFCNLTMVNTTTIKSQQDFNDRVRKAAFIGTLQAAFTDFYYLRDVWKSTTEKEALLGVSPSGIVGGPFLSLNRGEAVDSIIEENERVAKLIGINPAARTTTVKPDGTCPLVLSRGGDFVSSGVHAYHSEYFIRRVRVLKSTGIYKYLTDTLPELMEDDVFKPNTEGVLSLPIKSPSGALTREKESAIMFLDRVREVKTSWINPGHRSGLNTHNVSATIYIRENEWDEVGEYLWENREQFAGLSCLPYDGGKYIQAPFEEINKSQFNDMVKLLKPVDFTKVIEDQHVADRFEDTAACAGGACEIR